jgi:hypothetical protein
MFTPKGLLVAARVSRITARKASGFGWVSAVIMPKGRFRDDERKTDDTAHQVLPRSIQLQVAEVFRPY